MAVEPHCLKRTITVPADDLRAAMTTLFRHFGIDRVIEAATRVQYQELFHERILEYRRRLQSSEDDGA
jgi:hypothetical protein